MKKRNIWIILTVLVLILGVSAAVVLVPRMPKEEVAVFPMTMVGYTDYNSGSAESYGLVATDKVQTLYLSESQTITEILVYPGQSVKKGDVLFTYDTTLSDLAIERKDLAIKQLEMNLKTAQAELTALNKMKPIVYKPGSSNTTSKTDYTKSPADKKKLNTVYSTTNGLSRTQPMYFWLGYEDQVDEAMIDGLFEKAGGSPSRIYVVFQSTKNDKPATAFDSHFGISFQKVYENAPSETAKPSEAPETTESKPTEAKPTEPKPTEPKPTDSKPTEAKPTDPKPTESKPTEPKPTEAKPTEPKPTEGKPTEPKPTEGKPSESEATEPETSESNPTTANESQTVSAGDPTPAPVKVFTGYSLSFFDPPSAQEEDNGTVEWNDGYTSAELTSMRNEKQEEINQLQFDIKIGKAELNIMKKEAENGQVVAEFDGVVSEILEPAAALESGEPMMKVTGGGGYYVEGTVSELALNTLHPGQVVTVNSWDTGTVYTGKVVEIGAYPAEEQESYGSSRNVTYYPYRVFIDESADLQEGFYVSMTYQTEEQATGTLYLQNAFLRSEGNRSYVYVRGAEGLLEKRYLECGVSVDGYMTPIYAGITEEDYLAFPYGSAITEGAPTYEGTDQDLYGY